MKKTLIGIALISVIILTGCSSTFCETEKAEIDSLNKQIVELNKEINKYKGETDKQTKIDDCLTKAEVECADIKANHSDAVARCPNQSPSCMTEVANIWSNYKSKCLNNSLRDECLKRYE